MKTSSFAYTLVAAAVVDAVAIGSFDIKQNLKRAVEITSQMVEEPSTLTNPACHVSGGECSVAKRNALALAEAAANAYITVDPTADACYASGAGCNIAKRQELEDLETQAAYELPESGGQTGINEVFEDANSIDIEKRSAEPHYSSKKFCQGAGEACATAKRDAQPEPKYSAKKFCQGPGEACATAKRDALPEAHYSTKKFCQGAGEACATAKRSAEAVAEALPHYSTKKFCQAVGEACATAKRSINELTTLAAASLLN